jgi:hypothetical protein
MFHHCGGSSKTGLNHKIILLFSITQNFHANATLFNPLLIKKSLNVGYLVPGKPRNPVGWAELAKPNTMILIGMLGNASLLPNLPSRFSARHYLVTNRRGSNAYKEATTPTR